MAATTHSIEVNAPLRIVYNQWTQFEDFPRFMEGVEQIRQEGDKRLFWRAKIGGTVKEWEAEITHQVPDERIAWQSVDGSPNSGTVMFEPLSADWTRVTAAFEYEPEGFLEKAGDALGIPAGRVQGDLERFRGFIEERGRETGSWRGEIEGAEPAHPSSSSAGQPREGFREEVEGQPYRTGVENSRETDRTEERPGEVAAEVPLSEEKVNVGKTTVGAGKVNVHKTVKTEQVNVPVELKREDVVIERLGADEAKPGEQAFREEHVEVPLSQEEPVVEKKTHVTGGVRVRKTEGTEQETINESVRRENVEIDESGRTSRKTGD
jgi:uncharacterized protein (TIGR02271 family)